MTFKIFYANSYDYLNNICASLYAMFHNILTIWLTTYQSFYLNDNISWNIFLVFRSFNQNYKIRIYVVQLRILSCYLISCLIRISWIFTSYFDSNSIYMLSTVIFYLYDQQFYHNMYLSILSLYRESSLYKYAITSSHISVFEQK